MEDTKAKLVPSDQEGTEVEVTKEVSLMNHTKKELVAMIEAEQLKYKKLKTTHTNYKNKNKEVLENATELATQLEAAYEQVELANNEAATMSVNLRVANQKIHSMERTMSNFVLGLGVSLEQFQKALSADGVILGGE